MPKNPPRAQARASVRKWNERYPIGTEVDVFLDSGKVERTKTRSLAEMLGAARGGELAGHTAVIWLEGITGCYLLDRVRPVELARPARPAFGGPPSLGPGGYPD